ncbi:MAG: GspE/PulE family protein [Candidatus Dormibacteria bacterium]
MRISRRDAQLPEPPPVVQEHEITTQGSRNGRKLGEILVEQSLVGEDAVKSALKQQRRDRRPIGEILTGLGVPSDSITSALGLQMGLTPVDLDHVEAEHAAIDALDAGFVRQHRIFPLRIDDSGRLHVATPNPGDASLARAIMEKAERSVRLEFADTAAIQRAINRNYTVLDDVGMQAVAAIQDARVVVAEAPELAGLNANAPVVQIVNLLLMQGLRDRVSDIHIEPQSDRLRIRYRIDGALRDVQSLPLALGGAVASRLKIMANMDIVDRHRAQDGQTTLELDGRTVDIRIATMETIWGEKVVLRLLDRSRSLLPMAQLGLRQQEHERMRQLISSPYGLMIVTGPTGAGKTTTLYSALNELDRSTRNITTIEDPVEYHFANINQIQINRLAGMTFANGLRAILRQDPDVILVGEIRDVETAQIAVQSALTGHLVLASLHAADAVGALYRFLDMGVEGYLVASAVIGVVAQRLVRVNCPACLVPTRVQPAEAEFYRTIRGKLPTRDQMAGVGCRHCSGTGFYERRGVFECVGVNDMIREQIVEQIPQSLLRERVHAGGVRSLQDAVCDLVDEGKTTIAEAMRTVYVL